MRLGQGGRIDRARAVTFSFDGRRLRGFAGDTLASALLANGVHLTGRSFKYHRPRGILGAGVEEPNALVGIDRGQGLFEPNQRATMVPLYEGLTVESQNRWPSLRWDAGALNRVLAPFIPAGFYYKTFMRPRWAWEKLYEPLIRRAAGLGRAPREPDADRYAQMWAHCDLLIVGAGPAGLAAALAAAPGGRRIILCDLDEELGGWLLSAPTQQVDGRPAWEWLAATLATLAKHANVTLMPRTTAFAYGLDNLVSLAERLTDHQPPGKAQGARERLWHIRASEVVLATGAHERPIVFPGNDRPGIMLASAAESYLQRYSLLTGQRAAAIVADDSGYHSAFTMEAAGATIAAIIDLRADPDPQLVGQAREMGIEVVTGMVPTGTRGRLRVSAVLLGDRAIACDTVLVAGGWTPSLHLFSQARGGVVWCEDSQAFLPGKAAQAVRSAGSCGGVFGIDRCLEDGWITGGGASDRPSAPDEPVNRPAPLVSTVHAKDALVDFQNDVTASDIRLAVREGFQSIEHIKRYTTTGMATDQGRTSNLNALTIAADALDRPVPAVGLTTFRAPYTPTTFGTLAGATRGALFDPVRTTPIHDWAVEKRAVFEDVGQWKRARYFPATGEDMGAAVARECRAVRTAAGIFDASTLGKIEVVGPDAAEFLNRMYVNSFTKLSVGRCRYGVMCREDGFVYDDGVIARIADDRFHVTTTTGGAANVLNLMEDYRQTEFPELKVWLTSTTEHWATIAINGPLARKIVAPLVEGIDLDGEALAHMSSRECHVAGVAARLWRVSFTGELGFEINVPSRHGHEVWEAVYDAGKSEGLTPYGTETMHVLRAEKGYIIIGQDSDGTVTPVDLGLGWAIGKAKPDYVGKRSLARGSMQAEGRKQLVGLRTRDGRTVLEEGSQVVDPAQPGRSIGHVTSAYASATLGAPMALALVRGGRSRSGETLHIPVPNGAIEVEVSNTVFYDPEGSRLDG